MGSDIARLRSPPHGHTHRWTSIRGVTRDTPPRGAEPVQRKSGEVPALAWEGVRHAPTCTVRKHGRRAAEPFRSIAGLFPARRSRRPVVRFPRRRPPPARPALMSCRSRRPRLRRYRCRRPPRPPGRIAPAGSKARRWRCSRRTGSSRRSSETPQKVRPASEAP